MAIIKTEVKTIIKLEDVRVGDVFEFVKAVGCRHLYELLVVSRIDGDRLTFFGGGKVGNYGSLVWLEQKLAAGEVIYRPHTPK